MDFKHYRKETVHSLRHHTDLATVLHTEIMLQMKRCEMSSVYVLMKAKMISI